jgi:hypothetical protein
MYSKYIFISGELLLDIHPLKNLSLFFKHEEEQLLDVHLLRGRKSFPLRSLLRVLTLKNPKGVSTLSELYSTPKDNPCTALRCGIDILKPVPTVQRFFSFLIDTEGTGGTRERREI